MSAAARTVADLLAGIAVPASARDIVVTGLTLDSRRVRAGDAFVALRGGTTHGITFAPAALASGASVILAEAPAPAAPSLEAGPRAEGRGLAERAGPRAEGRGLAERAGLRAEGRGPSTSSRETNVPADANESATHAGASNASALSPQPPALASEALSPRPSALAPVIWIDNLRAHLGEIAARFFDHPSAALRVIGVTGTNGKTSIVQLLGAALHGLGARAATIGTLGAGLVGAIDAGERTTPDVISVHGLLAAFRAAGATDVAMEVSSHALDQGRVDALNFELAVFTNLTRDHLDYHGDMRAYGAAKARLFAWPGLKAAVLNVDDAFGRELAAGLSGDVARLRYAVESADAEIRASAVHSGVEGLRFRLHTPWGERDVATPLLGRFNVANLLAVAGCLGALGYSFAQIHNALQQLRPVAGRMNRLGGERDLPLAVVDYAHTPDALEQALSSLRAHVTGRLFCVFGCGGERDRGKRPQMAAIAEALADRVIVTDDNPRGEDGDAIVAQIVAGFARPHAATVQRDRARAIALALGEAHAGDVVLIAGKGHEPYQEIAGVRHRFDDVDVARRALEARPC